MIADKVTAFIDFCGMVLLDFQQRASKIDCPTFMLPKAQ